MSEKEKAISLALGTTNENYKDKAAEAEALGPLWAGFFWYIVTTYRPFGEVWDQGLSEAFAKAVIRFEIHRDQDLQQQILALGKEFDESRKG